MRLQRKLTIAFFGVSAALSVLFALFLYRFVQRQLEGELRDRLRNIAHLGAHLIDQDAARRLTAELGESPSLPASEVERVETSGDYALLSEQLGAIRQAEPTLIQYAYLLAPTTEPLHPRFLADADVLALRARLAAGEELSEQVSHFGQAYDITAFPSLRRALETCSPQLERELIADPQFGVSSVSAYFPVRSIDGTVARDARGRCLAVLGVDITDRKMSAALRQTSGLALRLSLAVVAVALLVSIFMGTALSRSVRALAQTVSRFADKDFSARAPELPEDEIGQLGDNFNTMAATIQEHSENLEGLVQQRTQELVAEKQTSERLLLNVLPAPIADRLKRGENLIADRFDAVSVLFADLVGFTAVASRTSAEELVNMLNELFSHFDRLAERHGLEKIKTIGDSYMVVAGVPHPVEQHALQITRMALDMAAVVVEFSRRVGEDLSIRLGVHTGSVVAGVIGEKKFIYDLWGDTVNIASRMESTGVPGRVQLSAVTAELVSGSFELEARGPIDVKGKGKMEVFLVVGARDAASPRDDEAEPRDAAAS